MAIKNLESLYDLVGPFGIAGGGPVSDMENQTIFHTFCNICRRRSARRNREKIVEFIL